MNKIQSLISEILLTVDHIDDLKLAINNDILIFSTEDVTYVYVRHTETLTAQNTPFEIVYKEYFY